MVIWIVVLLLSSYMVFVTKPAPTKDPAHNYGSHSHKDRPYALQRKSDSATLGTGIARVFSYVGAGLVTSMDVHYGNSSRYVNVVSIGPENIKPAHTRSLFSCLNWETRRIRANESAS